MVDGEPGCSRYPPLRGEDESEFAYNELSEQPLHDAKLRDNDATLSLDMLTRRSAKAIADAYHACFTYTKPPRQRGPSSSFSFYRDRLYDFLYVAEARTWVLNQVKRILLKDKRGLVEFIMRLHTGESTVAVTNGWPWGKRQLLGQRVLLELAEALLQERHSNPDFETYGERKRASVDLMRRSLELEGYTFSGGTLRMPEESPINEPEEQGVLEALATALALEDTETLRHHLELSASHYLEERWDDSISNSRKVLEWVMAAAANAHRLHLGRSRQKLDLTRPAAVRDYLEGAGLLEKKEKDAVTKVYGLLSETGGHPYVARKDQARLTRHLALTFSQFVLLRLEGAKR